MIGTAHNTTSICCVTGNDNNFLYLFFCHPCLAEIDSLLEGRCLSVMALKLYLCHEYLQIHLDMLDETDNTESIIPEVTSNV